MVEAHCFSPIRNCAARVLLLYFTELLHCLLVFERMQQGDASAECLLNLW